MKINGGATLWARQTIDSEVFYKKPHAWFKIWFYLINEVNHKDNKQFKRGSCFMKYEWIIKRTRTKRSEVDHCIRYLKSATMIATAKATRGFVIKVLNYNGYQSLQNYKSDSKSDSKSETKAKQKRNKSDTINKNGIYDKNDKNVIKKDIDIFINKSPLFKETFNGFVNMREKIKKPITEFAEKLLIKKLDNLSDDEKEQIEILNQSIINSWQGVFPLKGDYNARGNQSKEPTEDKYKHLEETY